MRTSETTTARTTAGTSTGAEVPSQPWPQSRLHPLDPPSPSGCKPPCDASPPAVRDSQNQQGSEKEREEGGERRDSLYGRVEVRMARVLGIGMGERIPRVPVIHELALRASLPRFQDTRDPFLDGRRHHNVFGWTANQSSSSPIRETCAETLRRPGRLGAAPDDFSAFDTRLNANDPRGGARRERPPQRPGGQRSRRRTEEG